MYFKYVLVCRGFFFIVQKRECISTRESMGECIALKVESDKGLIILTFMTSALMSKQHGSHLPLFTLGRALKVNNIPWW